MSYLDQASRKRPATVAAVLALHAGLAYALISGLAIQVIPFVPTVTTAETYTTPPDPAPHDPPPPRTPSRADPAPRVLPIVPLDPDSARIVNVVTLEPPVRPVLNDAADTKVTPPPPPEPVGATRAAAPATGRANWVTADDYPPQALREGAQGIVAISVLVGADGRVNSCEVTGSSGNAQLDDATCRTYARRARFAPARDAQGKPIAARYPDRVRWQLPE